MKIMLRTIMPLPMLAMACSLAACQTAKPSPESLKQRTEVVLGAPVSNVSNVRNDSSTTYYTVTTAKGVYACQVTSGAMFAVASMGGLVNDPPVCSKE